MAGRSANPAEQAALYAHDIACVLSDLHTGLVALERSERANPGLLAATRVMRPQVQQAISLAAALTNTVDAWKARMAQAQR